MKSMPNVINDPGNKRVILSNKSYAGNDKVVNWLAKYAMAINGAVTMTPASAPNQMMTLLLIISPFYAIKHVRQHILEAFVSYPLYV
jgi:hypothetical protein